MLVLSRGDVTALLTLRDCIDAVERAFRLHADGRTFGPGVLRVPAGDGSFHVKAAGLVGKSRYFAAKTNANFPHLDYGAAAAKYVDAFMQNIHWDQASRRHHAHAR